MRRDKDEKEEDRGGRSGRGIVGGKGGGEESEPRGERTRWLNREEIECSSNIEEDSGFARIVSVRPLLDSSGVHRLPRSVPAGVLYSPRMLFTPETRAPESVDARDVVARANTVSESERRSSTGRRKIRPRTHKRNLSPYTNPDDSVELAHGHLLGPVHRRGDLLLMLLREKG